jgi:hypothetical protein
MLRTAPKRALRQKYFEERSRQKDCGSAESKHEISDQKHS